MFVTAKMKYLAAMILAEDVEKATKALLDLGAIDFISVSELQGVPSERLSTSDAEVMREKITEIRRRVDSFLEIGGFPTPDSSKLDVDKMEVVNLAGSVKFLEKISTSLEDVRYRQKMLQQNIEKWTAFEKAHRSGSLAQSINQSQISDSGESKYLHVRAGKINKTYYANFKSAIQNLPVAFESLEQTDAFTVKLVYMKNDAVRIEPLLTQYHWTEVPLQDVLFFSEENSLDQVQSKITQAKMQQEQLRKEARDIIGAKRSELESMWLNLRLNELYNQVQTSFNGTGSTKLFSGWVPARQLKKVLAALKTATDNRIVYEVYEAKEVKDHDGQAITPPTSIDNPKILSPFQMLVKTYSTPAYNTVDPTPFVSILFIIMFGTMFADAGQGLVLTIIGAVMAMKFRKDKGSLKDLSWLVIYCGIASVVTGILFGSYFGYPLAPPLWFDYHGIVNEGHPLHITKSPITNIMDIMGLALKFGLVVIALSFLLNFINRIKRAEWLELIINRNGIVGAVMFGAGLWSAWGYVASNYKTFSHVEIVGPVLIGGALLLFLQEPLTYLRGRQNHQGEPFHAGMIAEWIMFWLIELMEFFINAMSNTLSFIRVAALGVAHVALMSALYGIADGIANPALALLVRILANILVIGLEGFSAGINSVRLNYYEFFGRYFIGDGKVYNPLSLRKNVA